MADTTADGGARRAGAPGPAVSLWVSLAHRWLTDHGPVCAPAPEGGPCDSATGSVPCT